MSESDFNPDVFLGPALAREAAEAAIRKCSAPLNRKTAKISGCSGAWRGCGKLSIERPEHVGSAPHKIAGPGRDLEIAQ